MDQETEQKYFEYWNPHSLQFEMMTPEDNAENIAEWHRLVGAVNRRANAYQEVARQRADARRKEAR
jgi:hypothetical protein